MLTAHTAAVAADGGQLEWVTNQFRGFRELEAGEAAVVLISEFFGQDGAD